MARARCFLARDPVYSAVKGLEEVSSLQAYEKTSCLRTSLLRSSWIYVLLLVAFGSAPAKQEMNKYLNFNHGALGVYMFVVIYAASETKTKRASGEADGHRCLRRRVDKLPAGFDGFLHPCDM